MSQQGHRGWGRLPLLQNNHRVPHVAVHGVHPETRPDRCPSLVPFHWALLNINIYRTPSLPNIGS